MKICSVGSAGDISAIRRRFGGAIVWWLFKGVDRFIAPTNLVAHELIEQEVDLRRIRIIPNVLDDAAVQEVSEVELEILRDQLGIEGKQVVLYVGRLSREKHLHVLLQAWQSVSASSDAVLLLVGDGVERANILDWREQLPKPESVILVGHVVAPAPYYRAADLFVFPSASESFGNVIVEAMTCGLPVISTSVGVIRDWGNDCEGVLTFAVDDAEALCRHLTSLLADKAKCLALGLAAKEYATNFCGTERIVAEYRNLYAELGG